MATHEDLTSISEKLGELVSWARHENATVGATLSRDEYPIDLGQFGEHYISVELDDDEWSVCPMEVLSHGPLEISDIDDLSDELRNIADKIEELEESATPATLDSVLDGLAANGDEREKALARALWSVVYLHRDLSAAMALPHSGPAPLPAAPLPWPGALDPTIDYTAEDFPQRYQPPPGFVWSDSICGKHDQHSAVRVEVSDFVSSPNGMILDDKGRVAYRNFEDGETTTGKRWYVWHEEREQNGILIPAGSGFGLDTPPRALDNEGTVMGETHTEGTEYVESDYNWRDSGLAGPEAMREVLGLPTPEAAPEGAPPAVSGGASEFAPPGEVAV